MKILMLAYEYPESLDDAIVSGEVKNPFYLTRFLKQRGHGITVVNAVLYSKKSKEGSRNVDDVIVYDVRKGLYRGMILQITRGFLVAGKVLKILKQEQPDLIHAQSPALAFGLALMRKTGLLKIPIVITAHGSWLPELIADIDGVVSSRSIMRRLNGWIQLNVDRFSCSQADRVISVSNYQVKEMVDIYKVREDKVIAISNGISLSLYKPDPAAGSKIRKQYDIESKRVILFVGRLARKKGLQYLIAAAPLILEAVHDAVFFIVGGSDWFALYETELKSQIEKLGLKERFIWVRDVPENVLPGYYNAANVLLVPSINYESVPTVIFEAMACRKPVIATNRWGIPEQISDQWALIPEKDTAAIAQKTINVLMDIDLANKLAEQNLQAACKFEWGIIAEEHEALYKKVLDKEEVEYGK